MNNKNAIRRSVWMLFLLGVPSCFAANPFIPVITGTDFDPSGHAVVTPGRVSAVGSDAIDWGRSEQVEIEEIWRYTLEDSDYTRVLGKFCEGVQSAVSVPGTPYELILLDGIIQPLILDSEQWVLWQLHGLGPYFPKARWIIPCEKQVVIRGVEDFADFDLIWRFDFSNKENGFTIEYDSEGGW